MGGVAAYDQQGRPKEERLSFDEEGRSSRLEVEECWCPGGEQIFGGITGNQRYVCIRLGSPKIVVHHKLFHFVHSLSRVFFSCFPPAIPTTTAVWLSFISSSH
jgi:hypothetical protein